MAIGVGFGLQGLGGVLAFKANLGRHVCIPSGFTIASGSQNCLEPAVSKHQQDLN